MKRARKKKSDMTQSEEYTGRRVFEQKDLLFEGGCHPLYEEKCLFLRFRKQNGEKRGRSKNHHENTLRNSGTHTHSGKKGKMREKNNLQQKDTSAISLKPGNRKKVRFSFSVEFTTVSGLG
jgi:hypothetical protein